MNAWDLVIFDNDGVLVDSEALGNRVLAELLTEYGYRISFEDCVRRFMGGTLAATRAAVEADRREPLPDEFEALYHERLFTVFRTSLRPVPGVEAVLDALGRAGTSFCVASSARHEKIRFSLSTVGLLDRFDGRIFSSQDVRRGKPAPDVFLHAASRCGAVPERCLVVEDSPAGVHGAKAAGMTVAAYVSQIPAEQLSQAGADVVVESMDELARAASQMSPGVPGVPGETAAGDAAS